MHTCPLCVCVWKEIMRERVFGELKLTHLCPLWNLHPYKENRHL